MRVLAIVLASSVATLVACGPSAGSSSASDGGTSGSAGTTAAASGTLDTVSATGPADGSSTEAIDPEPKLDVTPIDPTGPSGRACGARVADCTPTWPDVEAMPVEVPGTSAVFLDDSIDFVLRLHPGTDEIGTLGFELPCPQPAGAPKIDITRFDVPGQLEVWLPAKFEYTYVGTYAVIVDAELHNACVHLQVHGIEVDPVPIDPVDGPPFEWPALAAPGWAAIAG